MIQEKLKVIVCGVLGRMGKEIVAELDKNKEMKLVGALEAPNHPLLGKIIAGVPVCSNLREITEEADVIVDFTTPAATLSHLSMARRLRIPLVIGTTGFTDRDISQIKEASKTISILLSPNMSLGINLIFLLVEQVARFLGEEFDVEIIEAHHRKKKDAPSGTAHRIAKIITEVGQNDLSETLIYGRKGMVGERARGEIGIHSLRGGSVVGDHTVIFAGEKERIEITHRAESRCIFARGALLAAQFIVKKKRGLYTFQDVLKERIKREYQYENEY